MGFDSGRRRPRLIPARRRVRRGGCDRCERLGWSFRGAILVFSKADDRSNEIGGATPSFSFSWGGGGGGGHRGGGRRGGVRSPEASYPRDPPLHASPKRIGHEARTIHPERLDSPTRKRKASLRHSAVSAEDAQLDVIPVHGRRALRHGQVRQNGVVLHQQHDRDGARRHLVPAATLVRATRLIVDPRSGREVHAPAGRLLEQWGHEQAGAEHVLVLDQPRRRVIGMLEEQRAQHRPSMGGRYLRLGIDVGHQRVLEFHGTPKVGYQRLVVLPRLARRRTVCARVRREHAERQPPPVQVPRCAVDEAADVVTPVREAGHSE